jgi:predicted DNA-binding transcriptional regulator AlpA
MMRATFVPNNIDGDDMEALLTERQAAALLCLSIRTLQRLRQTGASPRYLKLGASIRYSPAELERWLAAQSRTSTSAILKPEKAL